MNIDIRDTVKYKQVMQQYNLGPNGAIMTSLNLFATRIDQVIGFLEKKQDSVDYVFVDTPGMSRGCVACICGLWHFQYFLIK